jgi:DNA-binding IclR family transcriptional regulator
MVVAKASGETGQGISRAMRVLRVIATQGRRGMSFKAIAAGSQLPPSTVHRLLRSLMTEGLVHKDARTSKYYLGHLLHEFGLLAMPQFRFSQWCQASLDRLAAMTQDTVYLSERMGYEAVATDYREGTYPLQALSLHVGVRRPLGVGAGGLAMLAAMPPEEAQEIVRSNAAYLPSLGNLDETFLLGALSEARSRGYAYLEDKATRGMAAVAVALRDEHTGSLAAISVTAVPKRMAEGRSARIAEEIRKEVDAILTKLPSA